MGDKDQILFDFQVCDGRYIFLKFQIYITKKVINIFSFCLQISNHQLNLHIIIPNKCIKYNLDKWNNFMTQLWVKHRTTEYQIIAMTRPPRDIHLPILTNSLTAKKSKNRQPTLLILLRVTRNRIWILTAWKRKLVTVK